MHIDRRKPPPRGGVLFTMFPDQESCLRDFTTRCDRRISSWNLLHTTLDQGTYIVNRKPPRGGGVLSINIQKYILLITWSTCIHTYSVYIVSNIFMCIYIYIFIYIYIYNQQHAPWIICYILRLKFWYLCVHLYWAYITSNISICIYVYKQHIYVYIQTDYIHMFSHIFRIYRQQHIYMYVCMYPYAYIYTQQHAPLIYCCILRLTFRHICIHMYFDIYVYTCIERMSSATYLYMYVCIRMHTYILSNTRYWSTAASSDSHFDIYVYICILIYVYTHVCCWLLFIHVYGYTHTYV